ncbi:MAG: response regulator [bacterium]
MNLIWPSDMKRANLLIVEDDKNTLYGLVEILRLEGYEVTGVENGRNALRVLRPRRFDVMLTDLKLPDISGLELHKQARTLCPNMQTVIMTAYSSTREALQARQHGVYELLTKPLNMELLFATLLAAAKPFHTAHSLQLPALP